MKNLKIVTLFAAATFAACQPKQAPDSQNDVNQIAKDTINAKIAGQALENEFASQAALGGMMEVESSARMIKFTENPDVQNLATIMVRDHLMANKELKRIAEKEKLYIPQMLPEPKKAILDKLGKLKEDQANLVYADLMVEEHDKAVALFTTAASSETNPALKAFAAKQLPILKQHATHAKHVQEMLHSIKGDKGDVPLKVSTDRKGD